MANAERHEIKPTSAERFFNRLMGFLVGYGLGPRYMRLLEVRGRKSGRIFTTPVNLVVLDGRRYLVAARGDTAWSLNARASGEVTLKRGSNLDRCRVIEIPNAEKPPVLKSFLDTYASQVQRFFPVQAGSPVEAFREMAPRAPVFELQSMSTSS
jgi:deazaflavin-dependent oxidoreductase (nitroreductase family)